MSSARARTAPRPVGRLLAAAVAATVTALTGVVVAPAPGAQAAVGVELEGRGYGHGRGMSQHGARGRADAGHTWKEILAFYYPGTVRTTLSALGESSTIRVWISADKGNAVTARWASGLRISNGSTTVTLPDGYSQWRIVRSGAGFALQYYRGSGDWRTYDAGVDLSKRAEFRRDGLITIVRSDDVRQTLRGGTVRAVVNGSGLRTVAVMDIDDYLRSVVPREMPASWHPNAVRAQAVAARTYAASLRAAHSKDAYDVCDTVSCQVFYGHSQQRLVNGSWQTTSGEHPDSDKAIAHTAGVVLTYGGGFPLAEFSAANGGHTVASSLAYQVAKQDPYDTYTWSTTLTAAQVQKAYPSIGTWQGFGTITRDGNGTWGGRVVRAELVGSKGSVTVTGDQLRSAFGLRSTWFRPKAAHVDRAKDWTGDGQPDLLSIAPAGNLAMAASDGLGGFRPGTRIGRGWDVMDWVGHVDDFAGDGKQGLVAREGATGKLYLYPSAGGGAFGGRTQIGTGWQDLTILPVTGWRSRGDVGLLARFPNGALYYYPANGKGGFSARTKVGSGWQVMGEVVVAGDWDGSGRPQLLAVEKSTGTLWHYPGDGRGGWGARRAVGKSWGGMRDLVGGADWDRDGHVDLLAQLASGEVRIYRGNGKGGWGTTRALPTAHHPRLVD